MTTTGRFVALSICYDSIYLRHHLVSEKVLWRSASRSVCVCVCLCVCRAAIACRTARRISLGGVGNVMYPVLSSSEVAFTYTLWQESCSAVIYAQVKYSYLYWINIFMHTSKIFYSLLPRSQATIDCMEYTHTLIITLNKNLTVKI